MFPPGRLPFLFEFQLLTPLTCACPRSHVGRIKFSGTEPNGSAVCIDGYTISGRTSSDAPTNEMGLPVDVLSEKREMQV